MNTTVKIRLLVIETDLARREVFRICCQNLPDISIESIVPNGALALEKISRHPADVILLDYAITDISLIEFTRKAVAIHPDIGILLTVPENDPDAATKAVEVLAAGCFDFVFKPPANTADGYDILQRRLLPKIRYFSIRRYSRRAQQAPSPIPQPTPDESIQGANSRLVRQTAGTPLSNGSPEIILIGVSTGGPEALLQILPQFPADFSLPVAIVLHMPKLFTRPMAETLSRASRINVSEAFDNQELQPGNAYLAPGGSHLEIRRETRNRLFTRLSDTLPVNGCRPSVDVLFSSAAEVVKDQAIAAILTGMGNDGTKGAARLKEQGAYIIAQDEASSIVWGMPGSVVRNGTADQVLPLDMIIPYIVRRIGTR
ncbi:MAG: chemotaxis-specific protein-glutamate methyltransferase CheB [Chitinispirillaceae bacterium]|nr:chemotaxis-specific protein-glutamate methyltransferase CheB [Chitinispirillaceae bacterium]